MTDVDLSGLPEIRIFPIPESQRDYYGGLAGPEGICNGTDHYGYSRDGSVYRREYEPCDRSKCRVLNSSRLDLTQHLNNLPLQSDLGLKVPLPAGTILVTLTHKPDQPYPQADLRPEGFAMETSREVLPGILSLADQPVEMVTGSMEYRLVRQGDHLLCVEQVGFLSTPIIFHLSNQNGQLVVEEICKLHKRHTRRNRAKLGRFE